MPLLQWLNEKEAVKTVQFSPYRILEHDLKMSVKQS